MKKLILYLIYSIVILGAVTGCNNNKPTDMSSDNQNYKYSVTVDNKTITLPISYKKLNKTIGFKLEDVDYERVLSPGQSVRVNLWDKNGNYVCFATIKNETDKDLTRDKCTVTEIIQNYRQIELGASQIIFVKNLYAGMKMDIEEQQSIKKELEEKGIILSITINNGVIESLGYVYNGI